MKSKCNKHSHDSETSKVVGALCGAIGFILMLLWYMRASPPPLVLRAFCNILLPFGRRSFMTILSVELPLNHSSARANQNQRHRNQKI